MSRMKIDLCKCDVCGRTYKNDLFKCDLPSVDESGTVCFTLVDLCEDCFKKIAKAIQTESRTIKDMTLLNKLIDSEYENQCNNILNTIREFVDV